MKAKTIKSGIVNILIIIASVAVGLQASKIKPYIMAEVNNIGMEKVNLAIGEKFNSNIVLIGQDSCSYCIKGKALLNKLDKKWFYLDVENNPEAIKQYNDIQGDGLPIIIVGDRRLDGYHKDQWLSLINQTESIKLNDN